MGSMSEYKGAGYRVRKFLKLLDMFAEAYDRCGDGIRKADRRNADYLHVLELKELTPQQRNKVTSRWSADLKARRNDKDSVEILKPIVSVWKSSVGKEFRAAMYNAARSSMQTERNFNSRVYRPRDIPAEEWKELDIERE